MITWMDVCLSLRERERERAVMDPAHNTSAAEIGGSNGNATVSDDSKESLDQVINSINKSLVVLHQLHLSLSSSLTPSSQLHLLPRLSVSPLLPFFFYFTKDLCWILF